MFIFCCILCLSSSLSGSPCLSNFPQCHWQDSDLCSSLFLDPLLNHVYSKSCVWGPLFWAKIFSASATTRFIFRLYPKLGKKLSPFPWFKKNPHLTLWVKYFFFAPFLFYAFLLSFLKKPSISSFLISWKSTHCFPLPNHDLFHSAARNLCLLWSLMTYRFWQTKAYFCLSSDKICLQPSPQYPTIF